ncbi:hypothetical protein PGUG_05243 [Meyerozyma guilliermondii ATCC 6260]|uniref:RNA polymerase II degradation factor 1 n=1 Tax=Meyerozyma guilliermondii (strain ATCC 6260 / CBS 566 / DSM 6381 / JCM 1539 / NBRC 10279 / NRRL Y-324) TaxID=294746 RepID=A5DPP2_PICGU|nr:uncharacterized protein PGUG_05243 [Meyerozyma guilliermondii ATCC 6260]EDK41145.2 hypothetical protein PGUG_05243 [Meyerozyma guilliermondii ATCC 6260]
MSQRRNNRNQSKRSSNGTSTTPDELGNLVEMFPDWESDDLASLLSEHNNLVEVVIDLIVNNKVSKWEPSRKEVKNKKKDKEEDSNGQTTVVEHQHRPKDPIPKKTVRKRTQNPPSQTSSQPSSHTSTQQSQTPVKREASSTSASAPPGNSWAAALAKDKPKPKTATKETKEVKEEPKEKEPKEQREPKSHNKKTGTKHQPRQETAPEQVKGYGCGANPLPVQDIFMVPVPLRQNPSLMPKAQ